MLEGLIPLENLYRTFDPYEVHNVYVSGVRINLRWITRHVNHGPINRYVITNTILIVYMICRTKRGDDMHVKSSYLNFETVTTCIPKNDMQRLVPIILAVFYIVGNTVAILGKKRRNSFEMRIITFCFFANGVSCGKAISYY